MNQPPQKTIQGQLTRMPFAGRACPAMAAPFPLHSANDFEVASGFKGVSGVPVLVSYFEHFIVLSALVDRTLKAYPEVDTILIKMAMPCGARLTPVLLQEKVLLCQDVASEREKLVARGLPLVVIQDSIIRNPQEKGTNEIRVDVLGGGAAGERQVEAGRAALLELLQEFGMKERAAS